MIQRKKQQMFFPEEIIIEIISKLPPKPLGRLKCVCKSWCSLISSPQFIKKHVRVLATQPLHQLDNTIKSYCLHCICHERFFSSLGHYNYHMTGSYKQIKQIGSCNGLVCLCISKSVLFLWNPCTGENIRLMESGSKNNNSMTRYAFCYNQESDDYTVVITADKHQFKIYSLRDDSWTSIDCSHFKIDLVDSSVFVGVESSVFVGGSMIWGVCSDSDNYWIIVSLDFKTKKFLEIPQPNYENSSTSNRLLKVLDGCLCVLCETSKICVDVWMMKEYGVKESWVKKVSVPYPTEFISTFGDPTIKTLCNSGVLMYFGKERIFFNFERKSFDGASNIGVHECCACDGAGAYRESIVSLKAYKGIGSDRRDHA